MKNTMAICIHFTDNVDEMKWDETKEWLQKNKQGGQFHMIVFTNKPYSKYKNNKDPFLSIVSLQHSYEDWYNYPLRDRYKLYKEIYESFLQCIPINHTFPLTFEGTHYFLSLFYKK
jgi:hypothetical protein